MHWKIATLLLLTAWLLPARHSVRVLEPTDDTMHEVRDIVRARAEKNLSITISHMQVEAEYGMTIRPGGQVIRKPTYFFHNTRQWYWPWWRQLHGEDRFYTKQITLEEVFEHGHLRLEEK